MKPTLYGAPLSPFVRKARIVLAEKGIDYDLVPLDPFRKSEELLRLSPLGRVPALVDDGKTLADSGVIAQYLEKKWPTPPLYADDPYLHARVVWFEKYADYELVPLCTFSVVRQRLLMPMMGQGCDEQLVQSALQKLPAHFDYLEQQLDGADHLIDNRLTVADIAVASQCINMGHGGECVDAQRWPTLAALVERVKARPSAADCLAQEAAIIDKIRARTAGG